MTGRTGEGKGPTLTLQASVLKPPLMKGGPGLRWRAVLIAGFCLLAVVSCVCCAAAAGSTAGSGMLRAGDRGPEVRQIQAALVKLGYLRGGADGVFGELTREAVKGFQKAVGLWPDGIVGRVTRSKLNERLSLQGGRTTERKRPASRGGGSRPELLEWPVADKLFELKAKIIDLWTGRSFWVVRRGGHNHADVEPATNRDAAVMKSVFGGRWSWNRRPIAVVVQNNRILAASMNGQPHGGESVRGNGFAGHFCVHFLGSCLHKTDRPDPEHQRMVKVAATIRLDAAGD